MPTVRGYIQILSIISLQKYQSNFYVHLSNSVIKIYSNIPKYSALFIANISCIKEQAYSKHTVSI